MEKKNIETGFFACVYVFIVLQLAGCAGLGSALTEERLDGPYSELLHLLPDNISLLVVVPRPHEFFSDIARFNEEYLGGACNECEDLHRFLEEDEKAGFPMGVDPERPWAFGVFTADGLEVDGLTVLLPVADQDAFDTSLVLQDEGSRVMGLLGKNWHRNAVGGYEVFANAGFGLLSDREYNPQIVEGFAPARNSSLANRAGPLTVELLAGSDVAVLLNPNETSRAWVEDLSVEMFEEIGDLSDWEQGFNTSATDRQIELLFASFANLVTQGFGDLSQVAFGWNYSEDAVDFSQSVEFYADSHMARVFNQGISEASPSPLVVDDSQFFNMTFDMTALSLEDLPVQPFVEAFIYEMEESPPFGYETNVIDWAMEERQAFLSADLERFDYGASIDLSSEQLDSVAFVLQGPGAAAYYRGVVQRLSEIDSRTDLYAEPLYVSSVLSEQNKLVDLCVNLELSREIESDSVRSAPFDESYILEISFQHLYEGVPFTLGVPGGGENSFVWRLAQWGDTMVWVSSLDGERADLLFDQVVSVLVSEEAVELPHLEWSLLPDPEMVAYFHLDQIIRQTMNENGLVLPFQIPVNLPPMVYFINVEETGFIAQWTVSRQLIDFAVRMVQLGGL